MFNKFRNLFGGSNSASEQTNDTNTSSANDSTPSIGSTAPINLSFSLESIQIAAEDVAGLSVAELVGRYAAKIGVNPRQVTSYRKITDGVSTVIAGTTPVEPGGEYRVMITAESKG